MATATFTGASGQTYSFSLFTEVGFNNISRQSAVVIIASGTNSEPKVILIAAPHNIKHDIIDSGVWADAVRNHDANMLYIHFDINGTNNSRQKHVDDLTRYYDPPMKRCE